MKEFHVKEPLYKFLYKMKERLEFCKSVKLGSFKKKKIVRGYLQCFTLFNQCWFIRMLVIVARCPRKWSEDFMASSNELYTFHWCADLQSSVFFLKLVSAIFIKNLFLHKIIALQKLFSFWRYSNFCISVLPLFSTCRPLLWRMIGDKSSSS